MALTFFRLLRQFDIFETHEGRQLSRRSSWIFALIGAFACSEVCNAADITRTPSAGGLDIIQLRGVMNSGDEDVFRKIAAESQKALIALDSQGGSVKTGIEIGKAIRLRGFATVVASNALCASACALTWLAGSPRFLEPSSKLGFHAAFRLVDGKASESGVGNALVGAYLNQMGLSENAVVYVTSAPPEGIEWLTAAKAKETGIDFEMPRSDAPSSPPGAVELPNDPLAAVVGFYGALAVADGETAAAFVIPDKRGKGPFSEANIHAFYSAMARPLTVTSTTRLSTSDVRVGYEYKTNAGRNCQGRADVQTVYQFGRTLISHIKALDGC
ncbi:crotonase/enoyl-CoA hydratase family protein (plasmid) [Rhizobium sp. NXC24]|nr:crotonase/enoyl-CoA hydratase family protein [Rhizobium sp. NXC24]